jgi:hypothetical protein
LEVLDDGSLLGTQQASAAGLGVSVPAHYLSVSGGTNSYSYPPNAANNIADGYIDIQARVLLNSLNQQQIIFSKWNFPGNDASYNSFLFYLNAEGYISVKWYDTTIQTASATATLATLYSPMTVAWLRVQVNATTSPIISEGAGSVVSNVPAGSVVFSISIDGINWSQIGATIMGVPTVGIAAGSPGIPVCGGNDSSNVMTGNFYALRMYSASGSLRYSPDFTALSSGQNGSFSDDSPSPNTWTINATII